MKKLIFLIAFYSIASYSQIENKIEGIIVNTPCEIEYTRNIYNQNNYTCNYTKGNTLINYTIHISNLFKDVNGLNDKSLKTYKKTFLKTAKTNAENSKEQAEYIKLPNGLDALSITSFLNYSDTRLKNTSVVFIYRKKSFVVNLISNDFGKSNLKEIIKRITF